MSTVQQSTQIGQPIVVTPPNPPRLQNGDRLTRAEFERRYEAMPNVKGAQLIEGIVYMPSPVRYVQHGRPHGYILAWMGYYVSRTPGVDFASESTSRLDEGNEPQPDAMLLLPKHAGGRAWVDEDGYISGSPDLIAEVAASSVSIDLHAKLQAYLRNGVREYLVVRTIDHAIDWFDLVDGKYVAKTPDDKGRLRSKLFPGLWLDPAALLAGDLPKLLAGIDQGTATDEHRAFVEKLAAASS